MKSKFVKWIAGSVGLAVLIIGIVTYIWPPGTIDGAKLAITVSVTMFVSIVYTTVFGLASLN